MKVSLETERIILEEISLHEISSSILSAKQCIVESEKNKRKFITEHEISPDIQKAIKHRDLLVADLKAIIAWAEEYELYFKEHLEKKKREIAMFFH